MHFVGACDIEINTWINRQRGARNFNLLICDSKRARIITADKCDVTGTRLDFFAERGVGA